MNKKNSGRGTRTGKVIQMHEYDQLLTSLGYETLISMTTSEEIREARALLDKFLKSCHYIDEEKRVILAYLFGQKQGISEMYEERAGKTLADKLIGAYRMGQRYGMLQAMLLFPQEEKN